MNHTAQVTTSTGPLGEIPSQPQIQRAVSKTYQPTCENSPHPNSDHRSAPSRVLLSAPTNLRGRLNEKKSNNTSSQLCIRVKNSFLTLAGKWLI